MKKMLLKVIFGLLVISSLSFAVPQMSPWDGVAISAKNYVKNNFNDPKVKYLECSNMIELSNGMWLQRVKLRATNNYGAKILMNLGFIIGGDGTSANVLAVDEMEKIQNVLDQQGVKTLKMYDIQGKEVK